jgi:molybdenum cofactor biosynthesis enzyme MoaA
MSDVGPVRSALVSVADRCDVGCRFCFRADRGKDAADRTSLARVLSRLHEIGVRSLCFTGGEPTDHPEFRQFCRLAIQFGILPGVVTSARTALQRSRLESARSFLTHVTVSADSHWLVQNLGSVRDVRSALETLDLVVGPERVLHMVVHRVKSREVGELNDMLRERDVALEFSPLFNYDRRGPSRDKSVPFDDAQWQRDARTLADSFEVSTRLIELTSGSRGVCGRNRVYVTADGTMRWCPYDTDLEVSLLGPRTDIHRFLMDSATTPSPQAPWCLAVCKPASVP